MRLKKLFTLLALIVGAVAVAASPASASGTNCTGSAGQTQTCTYINGTGYYVNYVTSTLSIPSCGPYSSCGGKACPTIYSPDGGTVPYGPFPCQSFSSGAYHYRWNFGFSEPSHLVHICTKWSDLSGYSPSNWQNCGWVG